MEAEDEPESEPDLERMAPALGRAWTDDRSWNLLTEITEIESRMGGHPGERRAAALAAAALEDAGVEDIETVSFPVQRWERGETELAVTEPTERRFEALALPYSPAGDVSGRLVDVGFGTPEEIGDADLNGAIAVASTTTPPEKRRFVHRMEKFGHAIAAGAEAFVFANHVPGQLPPTGSLTFNSEAAIPGIGVSHETGEWLREYAARDGRARLRVSAHTEGGESVNVHGTLGPDSDREVVILAHHDAHDILEGALDNGCGVAVVAGAARVLADLDLESRVRIATVGSEEIGLLGADALARELDLDRVVGVVNVDGAGRFRTLQALTHTSEGLEVIVERIARASGHPIEVDAEPHPYSDHWPFLERGVPTLQLHSEPAQIALRERGRGWGHTTADTRDKVDRRNLRSHAMLTALLVRELARADPSRIDADDLRGRLQEANAEAGMRASETWPDEWDGAEE